MHYVNNKENNYNEKYNLVKIGEFLKRNKTTIEIQDNETYKRVTIRINGGGISVRDTILGTQIGTKNQFLISKKQFLLSKIDARNGAFGVVPDVCDKAIITGNFWTFDVDYSKVNANYLMLFTSTKHFQHISQTASTGTTNRNYLQENLFLQMQIPLPPLSIQNELVNNYQRNISHAQEAQQKAQALEKGIETYLLEALGIEMETEKQPETDSKYKFLKFVELREVSRWDIWNETKQFNSKFQIKKVSEIIEKISTGTTPPTNNPKYFGGNVNFYTPSDLSDETYLWNAERKVSEFAVQDKKVRIYPKNTLLFVGIGSTVGKVGIIKNDFATSNQQITGIYFKENLINIDYAFYYFDYNKKMTTQEQSKTTLPIVNQEMILKIQIPLPPLSIQNEIVDYISSQKAEIKRLKSEAENLRKKAKEDFEKEIFN